MDAEKLLENHKELYKTTASNTDPIGCAFCGSKDYIQIFSHGKFCRTYCPTAPSYKQSSDSFRSEQSMHEPIFSSPPLIQPIFHNRIVPPNVFYDTVNDMCHCKIREKMKIQQHSFRHAGYQPGINPFPIASTCGCCNSSPWACSSYLIPFVSYYLWNSGISNDTGSDTLSEKGNFDDRSKIYVKECKKQLDSNLNTKSTTSIIVHKNENAEVWGREKPELKGEKKASSTSFVSIASLENTEENFLLNEKRKNDLRVGNKNLFSDKTDEILEENQAEINKKTGDVQTTLSILENENRLSDSKHSKSSDSELYEKKNRDSAEAYKNVNKVTRKNTRVDTENHHENAKTSISVPKLPKESPEPKLKNRTPKKLIKNFTITDGDQMDFAEKKNHALAESKQKSVSKDEVRSKLKPQDVESVELQKNEESSEKGNKKVKLPEVPTECDELDEKPEEILISEQTRIAKSCENIRMIENSELNAEKLEDKDANKCYTHHVPVAKKDYCLKNEITNQNNEKHELKRLKNQKLKTTVNVVKDDMTQTRQPSKTIKTRKIPQILKSVK